MSTGNVHIEQPEIEVLLFDIKSCFRLSTFKEEEDIYFIFLILIKVVLKL